MAVDATACPNQSTASTTVEEGQGEGGGKHEEKKVTVLPLSPLILPPTIPQGYNPWLWMQLIRG